MKTDNWLRCYGEGWGSRLRPASYSHPAKAAYGLTVRIYKHAIEEGWIKPGGYLINTKNKKGTDAMTINIEQLPGDVCATKFDCPGCGAPLVSESRLPSKLARCQRITCTYCGSKYSLPRPGEILCSQRLGNYTYLGMSNGDVYVSQDNGETWSLRHTFP